MSKFVRATGLAVAAFAVAAATYAVPSMAWEGESAPISSPYTLHAAANVAGSGPATNALDVPGSPVADQDFSTPVAAHSSAIVTTAIPDPVEAPADADEPAPVLSLAELVNEHSSSDVPNSEAECLAIAVYFESKSESLAGQLAVAEVVINRSESGRFPKSICGVVKQPSQFSFVRGGRLPAVPRGSKQWRTAVAIAHIATNDLATGVVPKALFFHATRVSPGWKLKRLATVGNHVFYR